MHKAAALSVLLFLSLASSAGAAVIRGVAYDWTTLEPASVVVTINTTPTQRIVAANGSYSFQVPKGVFLLEANQTKNGKTVASAQETIAVVEEGIYSIDLITWPVEGVLEALPEVLEAEANVPELNLTNLIAMLEEKPFEEQLLQLLGFSLAALAGALVIWLLLKKKPEAKKPEEKTPVVKTPGEESELREKGYEVEVPAAKPEAKPFEELEVRVRKVEELPSEEVSAEEKEVLQRVSEAGGSIGQKELRKLLHVSEAKASMLVSGLESKGFVKKIKKGRGNLVKLLRFP